MKAEWIVAGAFGVIALLALSDRLETERATSPVRATTPPPVSVPATQDPPSLGLVTPYRIQQSQLVHRALTFHGYDCTVDCSGHEAGYEWAEQHNIDDPDDCDGKSESFIEGCQAYAREQQGETEGDDMDERDDEDENDD